MGWERIELNKVCFIDKKRYVDKNLPYVGLENIESNTGKLIDVSDTNIVKSSTFYFDQSHLLYGRLRPYLNKVTLPDFEGHCSSEIFPLKCKDSLLKSFLFYWLTFSRTVDEINETCTGARMPRANVKEIMTFKIPLPPIFEQKRLVSLLDTAFAEIERTRVLLERNLRNAGELFESRLSVAFSENTENWPEKVLIEVNKFIDYRGKTPVKTKSGVPLITAKNVRMGFFKEDPKEYIAEADYEGWMTRGIPRKGDVLFTTEAPLANVTLLETNEKIALAQRIITMCPNRSILSGEYLSYCLQSRVIQERILAKGTGATVTGIKSKLLKQIPIPIAPIKMQSKIVAELDAIKSISKSLQTHYTHQLSNLTELKQSLLAKAFAGEL